MTKCLLTVGFLEPSTSTATTELLRLATPRIGDKKSPIVPNKNILDLLLGLFVDVLLVESDESFGDALADGVDLRGVATAFDADAHVDAGEALAAEEEDGLVGLVAEDLRLDELNGTAVDLDETAAALAVGHGDCGFLAAEALDRLDWGCWGSHCWGFLRGVEALSSGGFRE
ncbi:unnamed protein product [Camellia sinensis]